MSGHQKSEISKLLTCPIRLLRAASFLLSVYCMHQVHLCRATSWKLSAMYPACGPGCSGTQLARAGNAAQASPEAEDTAHCLAGRAALPDVRLCRDCYKAA